VVVIDKGGLTVMVSVAMSTAAVGVCESVTETLKLVEPSVVGVPLMVPPVLIVRPGGRVPDASAQVNGPLPPTEVSVVEYGTLTTAVGSAAGLITKGPTGTGGLPEAHERANPHKITQIRSKRTLFEAVINVLVARIVMQGVRMAQSQSCPTAKRQRYFAADRHSKLVSSSQDYGNRWEVKINCDDIVCAASM